MRCVLIGEEALLAECAALLLDHGHQVTALVSDNPELRGWARTKGVPEHGFGPDLAAVLGRTPFDHLLSVTNLRILPRELLDLPTATAVNFHDALLPRHAGMYATSWALLADEKEHGVTWHLMTEEADAGDILVRRAVTVDPDETAHTLDVKCFQAGIESFGELVEALAVGRLSRTPQDPRARTYHARDDVVPDAGVLRWSRSARHLHTLVRALDFGTHPNGLASAKLLGPGGFVVVGGCEIAATVSGRPPGTVLAVDDSGITVATADADLTVRRLTGGDGTALRAPELAARWHLAPGARLPPPDTAAMTAIVEQTAATRRHERYWIRRLADARPLDLAYRDPLPSTDVGWHDLEITVPTAVPGGDPAETVLAAVLAFLARTDDGATHDVGLRRRRAALRSGAEDLFAEEVPLRLPAPTPGTSLADLTRTLSAELASVARRMTYARDLGARYRLPQNTAAAKGMPVVVDLGAGPVHAPRPGSTALVHIPPGGRSCRLLLAADQVGEQAAEHLADDLTAFLAALAAAPDDVLAVPLLPEHRRRRMREWNDTARPYPRDACVPRLVTEQARRRPHAIAVTDTTETLTYGELEHRADRLAAILGRAGVTRGTRAGVHVRRSADLVVALLAVLKTGAAYVPLDPVYPAERVRHMIGDAGVAVVVSQPGLAATLDPGVRVVDVAGSRAPEPLRPGATPTGAREDPPPYDHAVADDPAYVLYTSGSTGRPKGVRVGHRALTNLLCSMAAEPGCTESDTLLAVTTVCFDIAGLELYLPLVTGARVHVAPEGIGGDGLALAWLIESTRPTLMQATPATWRTLIATGWKGDPRLRVLCGGEELTSDLAAALTRRAVQVWNLYGPTETTIWSAAGRVDPGRPVTLGRPIANTRLHVLDRRGLPVPPYVPGELYIAGDGVADGYLGRPELSAEKFLPDPFHGSGPMYRTGDMVRRLPDGTLRYLHRVDNQVKVDGHRVELGEIEAVLSRHPDVARAIAVVREDAPGDRRLTAYVVPAGSEPPGTPALRRHLARHLPAYMVPGTIVPVTEIPLTKNGKADRAALPVPRPDRRREMAGPAPGTGTERAIAAVWRSTLRVDEIGIDDNFFDTGGSSLLLADVVRQLRDDLSAGLTVLDMFQHPTVRSMARHLATEDRARHTEDVVRSGRRPDRTVLHQRRRARRPSAD
ncbi:amino acid adenylation domain-containing protein [Streptomyces prunicolor]|uniref:amino acid adenylation domain-containing protein n=1 Tax=Streptomyces prunicolor TaxID=67348 RepID=UPI0037D2E4D6